MRASHAKQSHRAGLKGILNKSTKADRWREGLTVLKSLKGTNCTMSLRTGSPFGERRTPSSPSKICMSVKSALPTPTMIMERGWQEARTMASRVSAMSVTTPSVRMSRMWYRWKKIKPFTVN